MFDKLRTDMMALLQIQKDTQNITLAFHPCLPTCSFFSYNGETYEVDFSSLTCSVVDDTINLHIILTEISFNVTVEFPFKKLKYYPPYVV